MTEILPFHRKKEIPSKDIACVVVPGSMCFLNCCLGQSNILTCPHLFYEGEKNKNKASKLLLPPFIRAIMQYFTVQVKLAFSISQVTRNQEKNHLGILHLQLNLSLSIFALSGAYNSGSVLCQLLSHVLWSHQGIKSCAHVTHDALLRCAQLVKQQTLGWVTCSPQPHQEKWRRREPFTVWEGHHHL